MAVDGKGLKDQTFDKTSFIVPGNDCKLQEKNISTKNLGVEERCAYDNSHKIMVFQLSLHTDLG